MEKKLKKIIGAMTVEQMVSLRDSWQARRLAGLAEWNDGAVQVSERMIERYQAHIDARREAEVECK